jgi:hypothetical protein
MGIGDFFKKRFGKQTCAFCGQEVGMLKRDKIKNDEFICSDCKRTCSRFIQVYRMTKDELLGHMEYMKRQGKLVESMEGLKERRVPSAGRQGILFYDEAGMFRIYDVDNDHRYAMEMIRYDQVAKYEPYLEEAEPDEPGKEKEFGECGVKLTLVGGMDDLSKMPKGLRAHPYITQEITVKVNDRDKHIGELDVNQIIGHFNHIFGVGDDTKGLFSFGPTTQQKREREAMKAMGGMFKEAIKAAKTGEVSEDAAAKVADAMNKVDDAATSGLAKYSRLADEAESKI